MSKATRAIVFKKFRFSAAHHLPDYPGACSRTHGHTYTVEIGCFGHIREDGMVVDFGDLKYAFEERVHKVFDHRMLNDIVPVPTTENVAAYILAEMIEEFPGLVYSIELFEGPDQSAMVFNQEHPGLVVED